MEITPQLDQIGVVVSDMAASLTFYRLLGLPLPDGSDDAPHVDVELRGGIRFALDADSTVRSFHPQWEPSAGSNRVGLAFLVSEPSAVDALYAQLTGAGYAGVLPPFDAFWGQRYATVNDPDGNGVDLFAPLPS